MIINIWLKKSLNGHEAGCGTICVPFYGIGRARKENCIFSKIENKNISSNLRNKIVVYVS